MVYKNLCILVLWMKDALALEGLGLGVNTSVCVNKISSPNIRLSFHSPVPSLCFGIDNHKVIKY